MKRAYLGGFSNLRYTFRGQEYDVSFMAMTQRNIDTGKIREIRPPYKWKPLAGSRVEKGPALCIKVPPNGPGTIINVPHPKVKDRIMAITVPKTAKVGQAMLVPIPQGEPQPKLIQSKAPATATVAEMAEDHAKEEVKKRWSISTCKKVASGLGGVAVVSGLAAGGAILTSEHIMEEGLEAMIDDLGETLVTTAEYAYDSVDSTADTIESTASSASSDFIMDLF